MTNFDIRTARRPDNHPHDRGKLTQRHKVGPRMRAQHTRAMYHCTREQQRTDHMQVNQHTQASEGEPGRHADKRAAAVDRRSILSLAVGVGATAFLAACGSSGSRTSSRIGEPIPDSPGYRPLSRHETTPPPMRRQPYRAPAPQGVTVIGRQTWATRGPILTRANRMGQIRSITVHHDGMNPFTSNLYDDTARRLEMIRNSHVNKGWADIGYHYAIDPAGRAWACRPETLQGAHVKNYNPGNLGILVLGNYEEQRPTRATLESLDRIIASNVGSHRLAVNSVFTHREWASTACPGRHIQAHMQSARASGGAIAQAMATLASA